ncbi:hypothetical protein HJC23_007107 [Cyclotella cryptica]|uniref:ATP-dependent RNA helicase n=1 Tax=Cyclotella cryptica TaxID=29204 RepID=A0ABD3P0V3_9STRA|eukprot:CCRYP_018354-RA/>CCRYP_018354-RA protein AED:0.01 eAED:0.01 QI:0/0/0/1/1/1/2/0/808
MFSVPRFDPNKTHDAKLAKEKVATSSTAIDPNAENTKDPSRKGKRTRANNDVDDTEGSIAEQQDSSGFEGGECHSHDAHRETNQTDDDSSSAPSSETYSSSSVASSSSEDDEKQSKQQTTLKIIAPSQPVPSDSKRSQRTQKGFEDEAIDDFDADFDIIENEHSSQKPGAASSHTNVTDIAAARALRLSKLPIAEVASAKHWGLPPFLIRNLEADSYTNFFPIQCMVIPDVIESERNAHLRGARDICCHAPTGSGKTLAFVLPLLTSLYDESPSGSGVRGLRRRLRALVVLPGRDLAKQVYDVFVRYSKGSQLRIGLSVGGGKKKADLVNERRSMVVEAFNESWSEVRDEDGSFIRRRAGGLAESAAARARCAFDPTSIHNALEAYDGTVQRDSGLHVFPEMSGRSAIDILVTTPGRLVDHLDSTPGFTLQHLRFLVIDEADRLVNQPYQNWVGRVLDASNASNRLVSCTTKYTSLSDYVESPLQFAPDGLTYVIDPITHRNGNGTLGRAVPLRKMLFSATLTQDPQKLAVLGLHNPKHFDAGRLIRMLNHIEDLNVSMGVKAGSYSVPEGLTEKLVECTAEQKPLVLLALLLEQRKIHGSSIVVTNRKESMELIIVFTSSVDSTHRLARLLQLLWEGGGYGKSSAIAEFSSAIDAKQRAATLRRCRNTERENAVSVIVCSDGMSRGMDLPSVAAVINYDVPAYAKTYVHRCGRTARAGRQGTAISVLKGGQVAKFRKMRQLINGGAVQSVGIKKDLVKNVVSTYKKCIQALKTILQDEECEKLRPWDSLDVSAYLPPNAFANHRRTI